jgi:hypothetical protein
VASWPTIYRTAPDRITDVHRAPPWATVPTSIRAYVRQGDNPSHSTCCRNELQDNRKRLHEGDEFWMDASYLFEPGWHVNGDGWQIVTQAHLDRGAQPVVTVSGGLRAGLFRVATSQGGSWTTRATVRLVTNRWYRLTIHGFASATPRPLQVWIDGRRVYDGRAATMDTPSNNLYWHIGYYRSPRETSLAGVLINGWRLSPTPIGRRAVR